VATYAVHLRLIGKLMGDFLLVIIELFSLGTFVLSQFTRLTDRQTDRKTDGQTLIGRPPCIQCSAVKSVFVVAVNISPVNPVPVYTNSVMAVRSRL